MEELKPCPFCGEAENIDYGTYYGTLKGFDYVQCQNCGAEVREWHNNDKTIWALDVWNRRADDGRKAAD